MLYVQYTVITIRHWVESHLPVMRKVLTGLWFDGQKYFGGGILKGGAQERTGVRGKRGKKIACARNRQ